MNKEEREIIIEIRKMKRELKQLIIIESLIIVLNIFLFHLISSI